MKSYSDITYKYLKVQKKRTLLTITGIVLSAALITAIGTMFSSLRETMIRQAIRTNGSYHAEFIGVTKDEAEKIKNQTDVKDSALTLNVGDAFLAKFSNEEIEGKKLYGAIRNPVYKYISIDAYEKNAMNMLPIKLIKGRLPQRPGEIIMDSWASEDLKGQPGIGDKITLDVGTRKDNNTGEIFDDNEQDSFSANEVLVGKKTHEYTIVGFTSPMSYSNDSYIARAITYMDDTENGNKYNAFVTFKSTKNAYNKTKKIAGNLNLVKSNGENRKKNNLFKYNQEVLKLSGQSINKNVDKTEVAFVIFIVSIIVISTAAVIYNAFNISVLERISQFGILRCTGASPDEIRNIVLKEAAILCTVGIPIGLFAGIFAMKAVMFIIGVLKYRFVESFKISLSPYMLLACAAIEVITVFVSADGPARRAAKVSPLDAVRNSGSFKMENFKKVKKARFAKILFGAEGEIAYKNLRRNKKKFRITIFSMTISIVLFIVFGSVVNYFFKIGIENPKVTGDFDLFAGEGISKDIISSIKCIPGVKCVYTQMSNEGDAYISVDKLKAAFKKIYEDDNKDSTDQNGLLESNITSYGSSGLTDIKKYLKEGTADADVLNKENGVVLVNTDYFYNNKHMKGQYLSVTNCKVGDTVKLRVYLRGNKTEYKTLKIVGIADKGMFGKYNENLGLDLITTDDVYKRVTGNDIVPYMTVNLKDGADKKELTDYLKECVEKNRGYHYTDFADEDRKNRNDAVVVSIFIYGFVGVIALIGCLNIINTISTNLILRKREIAVMKAVGMTSGDVKKMVLCEGLYYGVISSIYGSIIGTGLSYFLFKIVGNIRGFEWAMPWNNIIIAAAGATSVALLAGVIPLKRINRGNIIENIRMEE